MNEYSRNDSPPKSGGLWWVWLVIVLVILGVAGYFVVPRFFQTGAAAAGAGRGGPRSVPVVAAKARKGDMPIYLDGLGTVTPINTVAVHTRVDGQLDQVLYTEGQMVKAGDLLVDIDPRPFQVQLTQAEGSLIRDQALLKDANANLVRYKKLLSQNFSVTQAQVDTQQALVTQYEGAVKTDQGTIDSAKLNLVYCKVTSPITGRVGLRLVDVGNIVHAADTNPLVVITQMQPISVVFTISEDHIAEIMKAVARNPKLPVEAWDRNLTGKIATGTLLAVDNQVDQTNGNVKIKAIFDNSHFELFPNLFVNARLLTDTLKNVTIVPAAAVQRGPNSTFVYVVKSGPHSATQPAASETKTEAGTPPAHKPTQSVDIRQVTIGPSEADQTVIETGLAPGEVVVTDGVDKLQQGTEVTVRDRAKRGATTRPGDTQPSHENPLHPTTAGAETLELSTTQPGEAATRPAGEHHRHAKKGEGE
ncbi:MAG TPA: efflux RND transporter periplasmic adaptor subunit [Tepidisphaeraceae bacterium]|nr:efflux RND transporter periplasmic adaptor subunit [Tepidisphaeraceae bacterium]